MKGPGLNLLPGFQIIAGWDRSGERTIRLLGFINDFDLREIDRDLIQR